MPHDKNRTVHSQLHLRTNWPLLSLFSTPFENLFPAQHAIIAILHEKDVQDCAVTFLASFEENKPDSPVTILSLTQQVSISYEEDVLFFTSFEENRTVILNFMWQEQNSPFSLHLRRRGLSCFYFKFTWQEQNSPFSLHLRRTNWTVLLLFSTSFEENLLDCRACYHYTKRMTGLSCYHSLLHLRRKKPDSPVTILSCREQRYRLQEQTGHH